MFATADPASAVGLLAPYFLVACRQLNFLWLLWLVAGIPSAMVSRSLATFCYLMTALLLVLFPHSPFTPHDPVPRQSYCGSMGCVNDDERRVIDSISESFTRYNARHPSLSYARTPKILVPNYTVRIGVESWLFPAGGVRLLAFRDTFPLAFYYFQGSRKYTFKNYRRHVCNRLNVRWLRRHGIRFAFLPHHPPKECHGLRKMTGKQFRTVSRSGRVRFVRLY
jgi:hypothetical protein